MAIPNAADAIYTRALDADLLRSRSCVWCYCGELPGLGLMIAAFSETQQQAFLGLFSLIPIILISGFATPVESMLQYVAEFSPLKHF
jgi:hypothetical protein